jgi:heme oxygenase
MEHVVARAVKGQIDGNCDEQQVARNITMQHSTRRFLLREQTSKSHAFVDDAVGAFDSLESYRQYLQGLHAFRAPLEQDLLEIEWPGAFAAWRPQTISALLLADMDDLDVAPAPAPRRHRVDDDLASLLGTLYVMEGATLGSKVLYKRAQTLGLDADHGARHLASQSAGIDSWRSFLTLLEEAHPVELDKVVAASLSTFDAAGQAFKGRDDAAL